WRGSQGQLRSDGGDAPEPPLALTTRNDAPAGRAFDGLPRRQRRRTEGSVERRHRGACDESAMRAAALREPRREGTIFDRKRRGHGFRSAGARQRRPATARAPPMIEARARLFIAVTLSSASAFAQAAAPAGLREPPTTEIQ